MKEFNGSAGPWYAHDDEESMATSVVMNEFGDILCVVGTFMTSTEEDYANANLIASSPYLLETLMDISRGCVDMDKVNAAISKALGE